MTRILKYFYIALLFFTISVVTYWVKCQLDIDVIKSFHLIHYLPVRNLQKEPQKFKDIVPLRGTKSVVGEDFQTEESVSRWHKIWSSGLITPLKGFDFHGPDNSICLAIENSTDFWWTCHYAPFIKIGKFKSFLIEGAVKIEGNHPMGGIGVIMYDKNREVIDRHFAEVLITEKGVWKNVRKEFHVLNGTAYLKIRVLGFGKGSYRFDNIKLYVV